MLAISETQLKKLSDHMRHQFEQRMISYLKNRHPDNIQNLSEEDITNVVKNRTKSAESYGIVYENDIRRFIEYFVINGTHPDDENENIESVLQCNNIDGTTKMDRIDDLELHM
ncbi:MAG: hypothetical protein HRT35_02980 [Algicola sp.]|nr:hypothetical protein [Algicola sp.]